ncbi:MULTISPECIES: helix-turn-helix transcriptional regulator [Proteus]|jgi:AraC-like DNA-binding protein|uniref:AraC-family transcriptional regulator n=1 Tax=Proteus vulgaris TaxID=585 RepID=A0A379FBQ2_PROVU|nr:MULTISPECIES: helix-turn-helix transcriptional regulator [Proteus]NBN58381.1 helix-turn-helix domain-containing protein [Proteus sp. G2639]RNT32010.1 AraC family transcriptional regulator [Proteus mirabilis]AYY81568.1 AraC family transcriptional regulator [Proteus vulgaris]MBG5971151.1 helix-turn-helix transcriptional regulator [Proteus vulgaris]MBI6511118.1 helix-turn-helix transcriptional regulator [Proteus sp. PR00174]
MNTIQCNKTEQYDCAIQKKSYLYPQYQVLENEQKALFLIRKNTLILQNCTDTVTAIEDQVLFLQQGNYTIKTQGVEPTDIIYIPLSDDFLRNFMSKYNDILCQIDRDEEFTSAFILFQNSPLIQFCSNGFEYLILQSCPETFTQLRIEELLILLLSTEQGSDLMALLRQLSHRQVDRLKIFMEKNHLKNWKLKQFAREFGMGLTTFKELFSHVYGTSPRTWICERRIIYAHQLLLTTEMSIVDISMESGFSSQSYFTQSYHRRFNMTPSKARNLRSKL